MIMQRLENYFGQTIRMLSSYICIADNMNLNDLESVTPGSDFLLCHQRRHLNVLQCCQSFSVFTLIAC